VAIDLYKKYKYCPSCGSPYGKEDTQHGKAVIIKCSNCNFTNYVHANPAVSAVIPLNKQPGKILITKRNIAPGKGDFDLPGGFVDYYESPHEALLREGREELGATLKVEQVFYTGRVNYSFADTIVPVVSIYFLTAPINQNTVELDQSENISYKFADIGDIISGTISLFWPPDKLAIKKYKKIIGM
jgi:ADP-ribose pyrophosphatase YjhB (NUDIX family)